MSENTEVLVARQKRKVDRLQNRIVGLEARIRELERALASDALSVSTHRREIERAVTNAMCNVRMIPITGSDNYARILEVSMTKK